MTIYVVKKWTVKITGLVSVTKKVMPGTKLGSITELGSYWTDRYAVTNQGWTTFYNKNTQVTSDMVIDVVKKWRVQIIGLVSLERFVMPRSYLQSITELQPYWNEQYAVTNQGWTTFYNANTQVTSDMVIDVVKKMKVTISGFIQETAYVMPQTYLGNIDYLKPYFNNQWYTVFGQSTNDEYKTDTVVNMDITVQVIQKCSVSTSGVLVRTDYVIPETELKSLENYSLFFDDYNFFYVFDPFSNTAYSPDVKVTTNLTVQVSKRYTVAITGYITAIVHKVQGETLGSIEELTRFFNDETFAVCDLSPKKCSLAATTVEEDIIIVVVQKLTVTMTMSWSQDRIEYVMPETRLGDIDYLDSYWAQQYAVVHPQNTMITYTQMTKITEDMIVKVIHKCLISWKGHQTDSAYVLPGTTLGSVTRLESLLNEYALVPVNEKNCLSQSFVFRNDITIDVCRTVQVCNVSICLPNYVRKEAKFLFNTGTYHLVEEKNLKIVKLYSTGNTVNNNLKLFLCSKVTVENNESMTPFLVKQGQGLGEGTSLSHFLDPNNFYDVREANGTKLFSSTTKLSTDVNVVILDQCPSFTKERCLQAIGQCVWDSSKDGCGRSNNTPRGNGAEIALAVCCAILILAVIVAVVIIVLQKKKSHPQMDDIEMVEAGTFATKIGKDSLVIPIHGKKMVLKLQDQVGKGTFATVWKATSADGTVFAVKIIDDGRMQVTTESQNEADLLEQLDTQFVVAVYGSSFTDNSMAIAMEFFPLGSLQKVLQDNALSQKARIPLLRDVACSMDYLHSLGIVHRDLKPGNVLVCSLDPQTRPMCKFVYFPPYFHHSLPTFFTVFFFFIITGFLILEKQKRLKPQMGS